jgi:hypothetical protein
VRKLAVLLGLALAGCDPSPVLDAGADAGPATPDAPPVTTDHCTYSELAPTGGSGGTVTAAPLSAGAAEDFIHIPLGVTLGAYAARVPIGGNEGFIDERRTEIASEFAPSVGIETWPRVRAVALSTGTAPDYEETMVIVKCDLGLSNQAILRAVEARLPPELAGKVIFATSHSHGAFANYVTDALQVAFGPYSQHIHDILVDDMVTTIERALAARRPATIGIARNGAFDTADRATRDRRGENDALPGGDVDDQNLFIIRVDEVDGDPIAVLPVFGVHGTILGADNVLVSTDAPGGVERVFEEHFDSEVVVIHLQGAGGDTSPAGIEGGTTTCPEGSVLCHDYGRAETVGFNALPEMLALYDVAGADMQTSVPMEMVTRSYERGPDQENFVVRDGALRYAPWDGVTPADGRIYDDTGAILSPIDEFNAPYGAALCATPDRVRALNRDAQIPGTAIPELANFPYSTCNRLEGGDPALRAGAAGRLQRPAPLRHDARPHLGRTHRRLVLLHHPRRAHGPRQPAPAGDRAGRRRPPDHHRLRPGSPRLRDDGRGLAADGATSPPSRSGAPWTASRSSRTRPRSSRRSPPMLGRTWARDPITWCRPRPWTPTCPMRRRWRARCRRRCRRT